jgi:lysozyme
MRRRPGVVAVLGAVLVLSVIAVLGLEVGYPRYRPPLRDGERYGVDVSAHQGQIDWAAVAGDGIGSAYLKATEGATFRDPAFAANWRDARAAGLDVGAYHFFTLCRSGDDQARNLVDALSSVGAVDGPDETHTLPVVVDLELGGNCSARPPRAQIQAEIQEFVRVVEGETGRPVTYYLLAPFEDRYPPTSERARWTRRLVLRPDGDWVWWQVSNRARVNGIDGPVDLDVVRGAG